MLASQTRRISRPQPEPYRRIALAILACFVALGLVYSVVNPILESLDEIHHYAYIQYIADGHGLPIQRPGEATSYEQEGSQPPLYYILGAGFTFWVDSSDFAELLVRNPHARIGIGLTRDNQNLILHSEAESWPWRGATLAIRLARWFSILLGAGAVWGVYRLGMALFPQRPAIALGAMALTAFNPMFIYLSASVNNDNLITLLATWALVQLVEILYHGCTPKRLVWLGVTLGLASLAKLSGLALAPLAALALGLEALKGHLGEGWRWWPRRDILHRWLRHTAPVLGAALLIGGWWYVRNLVLYGELTGVHTMVAVFGQRNDVFTLQSVWEEFLGFRISYWGLFGAVNVVLSPLFAVWILEAILWIGALGALYTLLSGRIDAFAGALDRSKAPFLLSLLTLALWTVVLHISLLRWTLMTRASQGRLVFPAIGAISLIVAWGLCARSRPRRWPPPLVIGCLAPLILAVAAPWTTIKPAYAPPPITARDAIPQSATPFGAVYDGRIELAAYEIRPDSARPGEELSITLYWHALAPVEQDYSLYLHLFGREGRKIGYRDSHAGMGKYPTSRWQPGEVIQDTYTLQIDPDALAPTAAQLEVGLYQFKTMQRLPASDGMGQPVAQTILARVKIEGRGASAVPSHALDITLGPGVRLLGYDLPETELRPGDVAPVVLYWETAPLPEDYQVLVHLIGADGALVGQGDGPPMDGDYPTSFWGSGERLVDHHRLTVSEEAPEGEAWLYVGLYSLEDWRRLPVLDETASEDRAPIALVRILAP
jgi:hypothetical protein